MKTRDRSLEDVYQAANCVLGGLILLHCLYKREEERGGGREEGRKEVEPLRGEGTRRHFCV